MEEGENIPPVHTDRLLTIIVWVLPFRGGAAVPLRPAVDGEDGVARDPVPEYRVLRPRLGLPLESGKYYNHRIILLTLKYFIFFPAPQMAPTTLRSTKSQLLRASLALLLAAPGSCEFVTKTRKYIKSIANSFDISSTTLETQMLPLTLMME